MYLGPVQDDHIPFLHRGESDFLALLPARGKVKQQRALEKIFGVVLCCFNVKMLASTGK